LKINRFKSPELKGFPFADANIILIVEIVLMTAFLLMNAADQKLQSIGNTHYASVGPFYLSKIISDYLLCSCSENWLIVLERGGWWIHIIGIFIFLNYLPYSKHLHIMLAFPNTYFAKQNAVGALNNMPEVTKEVQSMLNIPVTVDIKENTEIGRFGAKDVIDLSWKNLLEAYSCTECGRCTSVCPANITGKKLSPRKIMMDTRDRLSEYGENIDKNKGKFKDDGKSLLGDYISEEEILACTTCNACVDACPININPVDIIIKLRQYRVMELSQAPAAWNSMFSNLETSFSPWKFAPTDRFNWAKG
jgi:heterodisulfide reductase subunit C